MHVAAVQYDIAWEDKAANHDHVAALLTEARLDPGTLVVLPEMGDTGFSFDLDRIVDDATLPWATDLARRLDVVLQVGDVVRGPDGRGRNRATIVTPDGGIAGSYLKIHPFSYGREADYFSGGDHLLLAHIGDAVIAPFICYDLRFPEAWRLAARAGATVMTIGANWPAPRHAHWRALLIARAIENQAFVVATNRTGADPRLAYTGGSMIISPRGHVLAEADDQPRILRADIDPADATAWRTEFPALRDIRPGLLGSAPTTEV